MSNRMRRGSTSATRATLKLPDAWVVRGERKGRDEALDFREGAASINWNDFLNPFTNDLAALKTYAKRHRKRKGYGPHAARQIWQFTHDIPVGALIVLPRLHPQHNDAVAIGWCEGQAYRVPDVPDTEPNLRLPVRWFATDMARAEFDAATQRRFNSPRHTVSRIVSKEVVADILQRLPPVKVSVEA